jgi:hypothetical protein
LPNTRFARASAGIVLEKQMATRANGGRRSAAGIALPLIARVGDNRNLVQPLVDHFRLATRAGSYRRNPLYFLGFFAVLEFAARELAADVVNDDRNIACVAIILIVGISVLASSWRSGVSGCLLNACFWFVPGTLFRMPTITLAFLSPMDMSKLEILRHGFR